MKKRRQGERTELTMNTRREIILKWQRNIKNQKKEKRSEMNSSISISLPGHMPIEFFPIREEKALLLDKMTKRIKVL